MSLFTCFGSSRVAVAFDDEESDVVMTIPEWAVRNRFQAPVAAPVYVDAPPATPALIQLPLPLFPRPPGEMMNHTTTVEEVRQRMVEGHVRWDVADVHGLISDQDLRSHAQFLVNCGVVTAQAFNAADRNYRDVESPLRVYVSHAYINRLPGWSED
jgi:hypothetical protein